MCLFEYDEKKAMAAERQEGREEGRQEGRQEGREEGREEEKENTVKMMLNMVKDNILSIEEAAKRLDIDVQDLKEKFKAMFE